MLAFNMNYVKYGLGVVAFVAVFAAGYFAGDLIGSNSAVKRQQEACATQIQELNTKHKSEVDILNSSIAAYRDRLGDARSEALVRAREIESQRNSLRYVEGQLRNNNSPIVVREINENCKATDIIVNTDNADRLRNCIASDDPAKCAGNSDRTQ